MNEKAHQVLAVMKCDASFTFTAACAHVMSAVTLRKKTDMQIIVPSNTLSDIYIFISCYSQPVQVLSTTVEVAGACASSLR